LSDIVYAHQNDPAYLKYQQERTSHWDSAAVWQNEHRGMGGYYHRRLTQIYSLLVPPGRRVLEIGCAAGDLLAGLKPAYGVGIDFSKEMIAAARSRYPSADYPALHFVEANAHGLDLDETFDAIVLSDTVNELWDVQAVFEQLAVYSHPGTRLILNYYSRLWELPLNLTRAMNLATPQLYQNWLTQEDVTNLLYLANFEVIRHWNEIVWPLGTPLLAPFLNRYLGKLPVLRHLALTNFTLARPCPVTSAPRPDEQPKKLPTVTVLVPARNEAGNIASIFERVPEMGGGTELMFVEGNSKDNTYDTIAEAIKTHPERRAVLMHQPGKGKGDAVRTGFACASGDILMILDADLTVPPEDLPRFYDALVSGKGDFINGVRLVYPMEKDAMRYLNFLGNKFFSLVFSWLLGQPVKDTLCGTKVLWKADYEAIAANRAYFGDFDPFGDFDLLFGAAKLNHKIVDLPIRYRERTYGTTNIQRWKHGWLLLRMVAFAARRLKFV
jgi:SAM-dependent methyltransferase